MLRNKIYPIEKKRRSRLLLAGEVDRRDTLTSSLFYELVVFQGKQASILDKGASALQTIEVAGQMDGGSVQVLVNQGYEPRHFLKIFKGKFIILFGSHEDFLNKKDNNVKPSGNQLFKIRGTSEDNVHAEQLNAIAASLASDDSFILITPTSTYVWNGVVCL